MCIRDRHIHYSSDEAKGYYRRSYAYSLEVEEDHSYMTPLSLSHNSQMHIRGINISDMEAFLKGEKELWEIIIGHSIHIDLRMRFEGMDELVQWVITESDIPSYFRFLRGENDPRTGNVQKALAIVKPKKIEEPQEEERFKTAEEPRIIDKKGAKMIAEAIIPEGSYIINPGDVGSSPYKYAYMGLIWIGRVKSGIQREDAHEYFFYPDEKLPKLNREFYDGRFIIRCFKQPGTPKWWAWKAKNDPYPLNPYCHLDQGFYEPIKAEEVKHFGKESYPEWEEVKEICEGEED